MLFTKDVITQNYYFYVQLDEVNNEKHNKPHSASCCFLFSEYYFISLVGLRQIQQISQRDEIKSLLRVDILN